jgi:hypothetical protein
MAGWLCKNVLWNDHEFEHIKDIVYRRFRELKIVPPTPDRIDRLIRSAISTYENQFFKATFEKRSKETLSRLDLLIDSISEWNEEEDVSCAKDYEQLSFHDLKADPGRPGLESVFREISNSKLFASSNFRTIYFKTFRIRFCGNTGNG